MKHDALQDDHQRDGDDDRDDVDVAERHWPKMQRRVVREHAEHARVGAEQVLPAVLEKEADADGGDQRVQPRRAP